MNHSPDFFSTPSPEQEPKPGSLQAVERRVKGALVANSAIMADGTVSERAKASAEDTFTRTLWQIGMIRSLKGSGFYNATLVGATWDEADAARELLSADTAARGLETWMQEVLGDHHEGEDPDVTLYRGYAGDLFSKLIAESARGR